jgi:putative endonuclease
MYYFYILRSRRNYKLYLGLTSDLRKRLESHNSLLNKATKAYAPYELIYYAGFKNRKDAIDCEQYFKTTAGWRRIHQMLKNTLYEKKQVY